MDWVLGKSVDRFTTSCDDRDPLGMASDDANGEWVTYSDYEKLEAELARVKAESLRVVDCVGNNATYALYFDGVEAYLRPLVPLVFPSSTRVQPVRLERWEATHDHD